MVEPITEAKALQEFCESNGWDFCFIGGLALQFWGEPRLTQNIELTILARFTNEKQFIETLMARYEGRISDAADFALKNRVLLLRNQNGIGLDISLGGLPFEEDFVERASYRKYLSDISLRIICAEDLIVMKAFAARSKDWMDNESIIIRQDLLDWVYILRQLEPLVVAKESPEILTKLDNLRETFSH